MQTRSVPVFALLAALLTMPLYAGDRKVEDYSETMGEFKKSPVVAPFFGDAYGYALFPTIGKGGLGIGASHGKGQVYRGGKVVGFTSTSDISIGFQAGGQAYSQVIFFQNKASFDSFTGGNFEFGAEASAIAIQAEAKAQTSTETTGVGASAQGKSGKQTNTQYQDGLQIFTAAKGGLMYQAAIAGQKYSYDPVK